MSTTSSSTVSVDEVPRAPKASTQRLDSLDLLRGLVMVIMVLDHTRDFFSDAGFDPTNLDRTTPALFFTRWITHFCAPVFVFLAGTGAYLWQARGRSRAELSRFLIVRGFWLILLEFTLVRTGMIFAFAVPFLPLVVLWAIGCSMIVLAALIYLPLPVLGAVGLAMVGLHNLADGLQVNGPDWLRGLWMIAHQQGPLPLPGGLFVFVAYPLIPWPGVMALGYVFGSLMLLEPARRQRWLVAIGLSLTLAFVAIRALNGYGEPKHWRTYSSALWTVMSFLNCSKYPPSLLYLLMTLGPALLLLALFERFQPAFPGRPILTFGRVPLFFYILQWPLAHGLAVLAAWLKGRPLAWLFGGFSPGAPPGSGYSLPVVYAMWLVVLILLYPLCCWFAAYKDRRRGGWVSYL